MTSLAMTSSSGRDVTAEELRIALIVPFDERRLFSRRKVLPAVHDALHARHGTNRLVPGHSGGTSRLVPGHRFVVFEADSGCSGATAPIAAIDLHYQQQVFIYFFFSDYKSRRNCTEIPPKFASFIRSFVHSFIHSFIHYHQPYRYHHTQRMPSVLCISFVRHQEHTVESTPLVTITKYVESTTT